MSTILKTLAREEGVQGGQLGRVAERVFAGIRRDDKNLEQLEQAFARARSFLSNCTAHRQAAHRGRAGARPAQCAIRRAHRSGPRIRHRHSANRSRPPARDPSVLGHRRPEPEDAAGQPASRHWWDAPGPGRSPHDPRRHLCRRQEESERLQGEFTGAGAAAQVAMAPELCAVSKNSFSWAPVPMCWDKTGRRFPPAARSAQLCG